MCFWVLGKSGCRVLDIYRRYVAVDRVKVIADTRRKEDMIALAAVPIGQNCVFSNRQEVRSCLFNIN